MTSVDQQFTPAMGRFVFSGLYDPVITLTREKYWRGLLIQHLAPQPEDTIVDVGCGTGTLVNLIYQTEPRATIIGIDPDANILDIARKKAQKNAATVQWQLSMGDALAHSLGNQRASKVCSSLVLHQCPLPMKGAILKSMYELLQSQGKLVIADFGLQRTLLMRSLFKIIQLADGKADTQPNADGILPTLMAEAGFVNIQEVEVIATITGSISIYTAERP